MFRYSRAALVIVLLALTASACRKKPVVEPPVATNNNPPPSNPTPPPVTNNNPVTPVDSVPIKRALEATRVNLLEAIYFEYDISDLSADAKANLDMKIQIMRANADVTIRIEGHCDSRGSTEYNIALGQRRAAAARQYLVDHGIPATRIQTLSLGEERPAVQGENDAAWARNRRDEFAIIAGSIRVPVGN